MKPVPVEPAHLSMGTDADGRFRLRYDAPAEVGALVEAALAEAKDHLFHTLTHGDDTPADRQLLNGDVLHPTWTETAGGRPRITWADALTVLATRSLDAATTTGSGSDGLPLVRAVRVGRRGGRGPPDTGSRSTSTPTAAGSPAAPASPRRSSTSLTCDGTLTPVWETDGHPVNVGRAQRVVPHRTRVLVLDRDRGCRYPGCGSHPEPRDPPPTHWRDGGPTDTTNLLGLCPFHHDGHHRGEFTLTGDPTHPDGLTFTPTPACSSAHPSRPPTPQPPPLTLAPHPTQTADPDDVRRQTPETSDRHRPPARLGRRYPAPSGGPLHLHLVDLTPT